VTDEAECAVELESKQGRIEAGKHGRMEAGEQEKASRRPAFSRRSFRIVDARSLPRFEASTVPRAKVVYRRTGLVQGPGAGYFV
jgi:hypothetical protein